jgi:hypothetical protein
MRKYLTTTLIVIIVILVLVGIANILVSNFDLVEFIKSIHNY